MPGTLTLSVEIELGWGVHDVDKRTHLSADGSAEREYLRRLVRKADDCGVPISFDVVGHLLLEECGGSHDGPYPDGWFDADPGTDAATDPLFYAPDAARTVLDGDAGHELCTHTFSHLLCHEASPALVGAELERVRALHRDLGSRVESFVPPRHYRPENRTLREHGVRVARYANPTGGRGRLRRLKELTVGPHPLWEPAVVDGVLETYCTTYPSLTAASLRAGATPSRPAVFRGVPVSVLQRLHAHYLRRSTRRAIRTGTPLHLWCHLYDLSNDQQFPVVADYLEYLGSLPEDTLDVQTMSDLATTRAADPPRL